MRLKLRPYTWPSELKNKITQQSTNFNFRNTDLFLYYLYIIQLGTSLQQIISQDLIKNNFINSKFLFESINVHHRTQITNLVAPPFITIYLEKNQDPIS